MIPHKPHHKQLKRTPFKRKPPKFAPHQVDLNEVESHNIQKVRHKLPYKPMRSVGKSNRSKERRRWQSEMIIRHAHINCCVWPNCSDTFGLAHAHRLKKTKITTREEWVFMVAKLCMKHHNWVEYGDVNHKGTHRRMFRLVTVLINMQKKYFA